MWVVVLSLILTNVHPIGVATEVYWCGHEETRCPTCYCCGQKFSSRCDEAYINMASCADEWDRWRGSVRSAKLTLFDEL